MSSLTYGLYLLCLKSIVVPWERQKHRGEAPCNKQLSSFLGYSQSDWFLLPLKHPLWLLITPHTAAIRAPALTLTFLWIQARVRAKLRAKHPG